MESFVEKNPGYLAPTDEEYADRLHYLTGAVLYSSGYLYSIGALGVHG
jgi:hypothetical protein